MRTALVRSLIAGSFSAVATLGALAVGSTDVAHAAEPCPPIVTSTGLVLPGFCPGVIDPSIFDIDVTPDFPTLDPSVFCIPVADSDLTVLASQTSPDDFRWSLSIGAVPVKVCNEPIVISMVDLRSGATVVEETSVHELAGDFDLDIGTEHVFEFATPCEYDTFVTIGVEPRILDEYRDQAKSALGCQEFVIPEITLPELPDTEQPEDVREPEDMPVDTTVPEQESQPTPQGDLPRTGSDNTAFVAGLGVLVVGAGLGTTALVTRRRAHR